MVDIDFMGGQGQAEKLDERIILDTVRKTRPRDERSNISIRQTSRGMWIARLTYEDDSFLIIEGHKENVLQTRGPFKSQSHGALGSFQATQESARRAVEAYRSAQKITPEQERQMETQDQYGDEDTLDRMLEPRE